MANSKCCWQCPERMVRVEPVVGGGVARPQPLATAGAVDGHSLRPRAADRDHVGSGPPGSATTYQDYYYFLAALGRKTKSVATQLLVVAAADLAAAGSAAGGHRRHAHQAIRAEGRRGRHPSQPHAGPGRPEVSVWTHLGDALAGRAASTLWGRWPCRLRPCSTSARKRWPRFPKWRGWTFATKLVLAARLVEWIAPIVKKAGKTLWIVVDGGYVKAPFLETRPAGWRDGHRPTAQGRGACATCHDSRDAASGAAGPSAQVRQEQNQPGQARRPSPTAGRRPNAPSTARRSTKLYKTFLATYRPVGGVIRVVIVEEDHDWYPVLLDRPERHGGGDYRSLCRPRHDRAGLPRREGSLGRGPAAGAEHLDQRGGLSSESLDAYAGGTLVLGTALTTNSAIAAIRRGTTPNAVRLTPTAAKPYGDTSCEHELSTLAAAWRLPRKILQLAKRLMALAV